MINEKVLLLCPKFFGYEYKIYSKIKELNYDADLIIDTPSANSLLKGLIRLFRPLFKTYLYRKLTYSLNNIGNKQYNKILIVKGEYISEDIIFTLRYKYPDAEIIYYNWDSIKNSKYASKIISLVDRAYTFDPIDAERVSKLSLLPLFYIDEYRSVKDSSCENIKYDICFIGTARKGRFEYINNIFRHFSSSGSSLYFHIYLQSRFNHFINRILIKGYNAFDKNFLSYTPLSSAQVKEVFDLSRAILDIQHPSQSGLTIRTLECLASNKKLITTNDKIKDYDFYNKNNIFILKNDNSHELVDFINISYVSISEDLVNKYSLDSWVKTILGDRNG
ncbi:TPA: hypothetical protein ACMDN5_002143 [Vibrio cholerae]